MSNTDYLAALELRKIYRVVPDADAAQDGDVRLIDESGEDYLYPATISSLSISRQARFVLCGSPSLAKQARDGQQKGPIRKGVLACSDYLMLLSERSSRP